MLLTGILGGAFDPVHFGHLRMAQELADALSLEEVRFIPTASPPHRPQSRTSITHRLAMVKLAIAGNSLFRFDDRELTRFLEEKNPSYTIDTLLSLEHEGTEERALCLLLGADAFLGLPTWHRWQEILDHCHIVVAHRPNSDLEPKNFAPPLKTLWQKCGISSAEALSEKRAGCILMQPITALDISATRIRQYLAEGKNPRYLLPDLVMDYIRAEDLYR